MLRRKPVAVRARRLLFIIFSHPLFSRVTFVQDYDISFLITNFHTEAMCVALPQCHTRASSSRLGVA